MPQDPGTAAGQVASHASPINFAM